MGEMRDSDWSRQFLLRSDWLPTKVATITTDVTGYNINFSPSPSFSKYTLFIVFYHWINRNFSLIKKNPSNSNPLLKLNYDKTNNKVNLTIHKTTQNIDIPSSFNGKKL